MKTKGDHVTLTRYLAMHKNDLNALKDPEKRKAFGLYLCNESTNFWFHWKGFDNEVRYFLIFRIGTD